MAGERDGGAGRPTRDEETGARAHRWAVDRVEEGTAAVEQDGDHVYEIPRYLIPAGARDGDVLAVTVTGGAAGEVTISVRIDRAASAPSPAAKPPRTPKRTGNDRGGDIVL